MVKHRGWFPAMVAAGLLAGGCTPAIHIIKPDRNNPFEPVTQAVVTFETKFNPGYGWSVDVDGANLTGFSPAPAPGGTSSVPLVIGAPAAHKITASASCGTFCVYNSDVVDFTPPALIYNSTSYVRVDLNLRQFQQASAYVGVQNFRTVPINVTIVETSFPKRVKLATPTGAFQPPGTPVTVTIPAANTKADFRLEGDVLGFYVLGFSAPGVSSGVGGGNVTP
jgi:hypothetical protein